MNSLEMWIRQLFQFKKENCQKNITELLLGIIHYLYTLVFFLSLNRNAGIHQWGFNFPPPVGNIWTNNVLLPVNFAPHIKMIKPLLKNVI